MDKYGDFKLNDLVSIDYSFNKIREAMAAVTVSPKFQVVIPKRVRESMGLVAGDRVEVIELPGRIELVPVKPLRDLRGSIRNEQAAAGGEGEP